MKLLNKQQIQQKIKRLSIEILENNYGEEQLILAGINNNGWGFAEKIYAELSQLTTIDLKLTRIRLNPANPVAADISIEMPLEDIEGKVIIIVDDVANTGRTIFYASKPLLTIIPKKLKPLCW